MTSVPAPDRFRSRFFSARTLHLFTLCGFSVTQPLLTALEQQAVYVYDEHIDWLEISILLVLLLLILPLIVFVVDQVVLRISKFARGYGRNTVFFFLFTILVLSFLRPGMAAQWLVKQGVAALVAFSIAFPCSYLFLYLYERFAWFRSWLSFASIGLIIFPSSFLWQFQAIRRVETPPEKRVQVKNPVPVVFVVFDEFNATTLMNEQMEIDSTRFPGFARLAELSTWYRNMTTVHPRTWTAVPAILSGRFPVTEKPPVAAEFPGNLFQLVEASKRYDMAVFEPATRICPRSLRLIPEPTPPLAQRCVSLIHTLAAVYPHLIFTNDSPIYFPAIPKPWFGIHLNSTSASLKSNELTEGLFAYSRGLNRNLQLEHFLRCLLPSEKPRFCFIHAMIPHYPWCFLPNGQKYQAESVYAHGPPVAFGELGEDWPVEPQVALRFEYRYRLQVGYIDRFISELLDRLKETEMMDRCLLIVTADHGVAFRPGHSRRVPDADNVAEVMSVPLFIKLPGQTEGTIDDRNVETVDLFPTVAEVLGLDPPEPVDGLAVSQDSRRPRKTIYFEKSMSIIEPDFPQLAATVKRQAQVFGSEPLDHIPIEAVSRPEWRGRPVTEFKAAQGNAFYEPVEPLAGLPSLEDMRKTSLNDRFLCGLMITNGFPTNSDEVVLAVDGIIRDSYKTGAHLTVSHYFEFLLLQSQSTNDSEKIDLYLVEQSNDGLMLRPLKPKAAL